MFILQNKKVLKAPNCAKNIKEFLKAIKIPFQLIRIFEINIDAVFITFPSIEVNFHLLVCFQNSQLFPTKIIFV